MPKDTGRTNYRTDLKTQPECQKEPTTWSCNKFHVLSCSSVASWLHPAPAVLFKIDSPHPVITHLFGRCLDITLDLRLVCKSWGFFWNQMSPKKKRSTTTPLKHPSNETCQRSYWFLMHASPAEFETQTEKKTFKKWCLTMIRSMWSIYTLTAAPYLVVSL